ncbi:glycosyltransferase family 2 protein [Phyllobacterium sp. TAF24]|uniref:glycosyltransferase family 2 protein n=1 Tax=Phyllobacterium sp. TAF24 TaxID=3233068 RepID=UPI003F9E5BDD
MNKQYLLDVVIPCYCEEETIPHTVPELINFLNTCIKSSEFGMQSFRLILVDDGSKDRTWSIIKDFTEKLPVKGIKLSRNYGHQSAMLAGLTIADADVVLTIDADLQDDISTIGEMLKAYQEGVDLALGVRSSRGNDSVIKKSTAIGYYKLMRAMGVNIIEDHADFRLMSRRSLDVLLAHQEVNLFLRGVIPSIGFPTKIIHYERQDREFGETRYTLRKMLGLAINGITSFSVVPLRFVAFTGAAFSFAAFVGVFWVIIVRVFFYGDVVPGWASIALPILFLGGVQLFSLGIVGEYIGKIYLEVKKRPRFVIEATTND